MFHHLDEALTFAFRVSDSVPLKVASFSSSSRTTGEHLTPLDLHAQAAMILHVVDNRLPELSRLFVYARFHNSDLVQRKASEYIRQRHIDHALKIDHGLSTELVWRYFARKRDSKRSIATRNDVRLNTVRYWENKINALLNTAWIQAEAILEPYLVEHGVILLD